MCRNPSCSYSWRRIIICMIFNLSLLASQEANSFAAAAAAASRCGVSFISSSHFYLIEDLIVLIHVH